jgi:PAS domain S-box-containing protein
MARIVSGTLDLEQVLNLAAEHTLDLLDMDRCLVALFDEAGKTLRGAAQRGFPPEVASILLEEELNFTDRTHRAVLGELQPLVIEELSADPYTGFEETAMLGLQSIVVVPMAVGEQRLGLMLLGTEQPKPQQFTAEAGELTLAMASQVALAIENARLYRTAQEELVARTLAEEALQEAHDELERRVEERTAELRVLSSAIEQSNSSIAIIGSDGSFEYANQAFYKSRGLSPDEVIGESWPGYGMPRSTLRDRLSEIEETLRRGDVWRGEVSHWSGRSRWTESTIFPVRGADGSITHTVHVDQDITERKLAEDALRRSENRLSSFMDAATDSFYLLDSNLDFVEINERALSVVGMPKEDIIGKNIADIVPDIKESGRYDRHLEVMRTGEPYVVEDFVPHPVFGDRHFMLKSFKVGDGLGVIASDITMQKQAEEALQRYAERLEILNEIDRGILAAQSPSAIGEAVLGRIRSLIPCQRAGVVLVDIETGEAKVLAFEADIQSMIAEDAPIPLEHLEDVVATLLQGKTAAFEDLQSRGVVMETLHEEGVRASVNVPLMFKDELIGALTFWMTERGSFSSDHESIARQLADQLAIAIQQARLYEQVQRHADELERRVADRTRELAALYAVAAVGSEALILDAMLTQQLEQVVAAMQSDVALIHLLDERERALRLSTHRGLDAEIAAQAESVSSEEGLAGWIMEHGETLIVTDIASDPTLPIEGEFEPTMYAGAPMRAGGRVVGVLTVARPATEEQYSEEEGALLSSIGDQIGAVVERARYHEAEQRRAEQLRAINEVGRRITTILTVDELLDEIVHLIRDALGYYLVGVALVEGDELDFRAAVCGSQEEPWVVHPRLKVGEEGISGLVAKTGEPLLVRDVNREPQYYPLPGESEIRSELALPLRAREGVLGVLVVASDRLNGFDEGDVDVLQALAQQAAIAIENAQLYQMAQQVAVLEERQRLARDLHDSVTQSLYSLTLLAETGRRSADAGDLENLETYLGRLGQVSQQTLKEMRLLVYELRPPALEREGLVGALQQRLDAVEGRAGVETRFLVKGHVHLSAAVEEALYRITLEALNNALKHSAATSVAVEIRGNDEYVELEVVDDGGGFDPEAVVGMGGMGLNTMRERAEALGGTLTIEAMPGEGTQVRVRVRTRGVGG